jgi:hypothetical protein
VLTVLNLGVVRKEIGAMRSAAGVALLFVLFGLLSLRAMF